jgi:hypothetical protein
LNDASQRIKLPAGDARAGSFRSRVAKSAGSSCI